MATSIKNRTTIDNADTQSGSSDKSSIDRLFGEHTNSVIVGILFLCTLISFIIYLCVFKNQLSDTISTGFIGLLSGLAGFFVASLHNETK